MKSHVTERFRKAFRKLPPHVQRQARAAYQLFEKDPYYPSLRFRRVHPIKPVYSVRISLAYRALGVRYGEEIIWFWIGSHGDYAKLLSEL
jgi:hypothetical protein